MQAYEALSRIYDRLMDRDEEAWFAQQRKLFHEAGIRVQTLADVACGTGRFAIRWADEGAQVIGTDISESMLGVAAESARKQGVSVRWVQQDMRKLMLPRPVDAILCACDGLNYLLHMQAVHEALNAWHQALRPGGALCFDISTRYKLEKKLADQFYAETDDDLGLVWQNTYQKRVLTMDITLFLKQADGMYQRYDEIHKQRAHDVDEIIQCLQDCHFNQIRVTDLDGNPLQEDSERALFFAIRDQYK